MNSTSGEDTSARSVVLFLLIVFIRFRFAASHRRAGALRAIVLSCGAPDRDPQKRVPFFSGARRAVTSFFLTILLSGPECYLGKLATLVVVLKGSETKGYVWLYLSKFLLTDFG